MTYDDSARPTLLRRTRNLLLDPQGEWRRVADQAPGGELGAHVAPLAIVAALTGLAADFLYGGMRIDAALSWEIVWAGVGVVLALAAVTLAGAVTNFLAPRFGSNRDGARTHQLAAYAATPILISGISAIVPLFEPLVLLAGVIYAVVLFSLGARTLLPGTELAIVPFTLSFVGIGVAGAAAFAIVATPLLNDARDRLMQVTAAMLTPQNQTETAEERMSEVMRALTKTAELHGNSFALPRERFEAQFPATLPGGFVLRETSHSATPGIEQASASYARDGSNLAVTISRIGARADVSSLGGAFDVTPGQRADGYARVNRADERTFIEEIAAERVRFAVIGRGVALHVEGQGALTADEARAAAETIDIGRIETNLR